MKEKYFMLALPIKIKEEIKRLLLCRNVSDSDISEIRIRAYGKNSVTVRGERIYLSSKTNEKELSESLKLLCDGAIYAHRDSIEDGYITLKSGIRVGIAGRARYDSGKFIGISDISSLVFRIPTEISECKDELYSEFMKASCGMLIYSKPGVGKTTALRSLTGLLGTGKKALQVVVIDERGEFASEDYSARTVDIITGHKRAKGAQIALRTLSPDVIVLDEIGSLEESESLTEALNSGVKIVASAHASSFEELLRRASIRPFLERKVFDVYCGLSLCDNRRMLTFTRSEK